MEGKTTLIFKALLAVYMPIMITKLDILYCSYKSLMFPKIFLNLEIAIKNTQIMKYKEYYIYIYIGPNIITFTEMIFSFLLLP